MNNIFSVLLFSLLYVAQTVAHPGVITAQQPSRNTPDANRGAAPVTDASCERCHANPIGKIKSVTPVQLTRSVHQGIGCTDCHASVTTVPHARKLARVDCSACHEEISNVYKQHGRATINASKDAPTCADCHGSHEILASKDKASSVNPTTLPVTCGKCHENQSFEERTKAHLINPISVYTASVHSHPSKTRAGPAASCNDCHFSNNSGHKILPAVSSESTVNYFNIPKTCGKCHASVLREYSAGIHGQLLAQGQAEAPSCTKCHGEHRILSPKDPKSSTSSYRVVESTCEPCHESATLNEKYNVPVTGHVSYLDAYHGLKSEAGGKSVANCASCHEAHRTLPATDPTSSINKRNLTKTCGRCHRGISEVVASIAIHQPAGSRWSGIPRIIEVFYVWLIVLLIGGMFVYVMMDLIRHIINVAREKQVKRMEPVDVVQHVILATSFFILVVTGFSLRYYDTWYGRLLFGFEGGSQLRGLTHRIAGVVLMAASLIHTAFLFTARGRVFFKDMFPRLSDISDAWSMVVYLLGRRAHPPRMGRFTFAEKVEYWALVWGTAIMAVTGCILWLKNAILFPKLLLDICLVVHSYEAWLAFLAILVWHLYHTVFSPKVYPLNMACLTGKMPERVYVEEHAATVDGHSPAAQKPFGGGDTDK